MKNDSHGALLTLPVQMDFLPVATCFVEHTSSAFGLAQHETLALTLATEEVFAYLCGLGQAERVFEMRCRTGIYYAQVDFQFIAKDFDMTVFNLTSKVSVEDQDSLAQMGLLLAARSVDHFSAKSFENNGLTLSLIKEKAYPKPQPKADLPLKNLVNYEVRLAEKEEFKLFSRLLVQEYEPLFYLPDFAYPGKLVDMVASEEYQVVLAVDNAGAVGGGLAWRWLEEKTVACFGPYLFGREQGTKMAEDLLEYCMSAIARTGAQGLLNRLPTPQLPKEQFESLGVYHLQQPDGTLVEVPAYFRQLSEDTGEVVWSHPDLKPFLHKEYARLFLPREIRTVQNQGEAKYGSSVLAADLSRPLGFATLYPVRQGEDAEENLSEHIKVLTRQKMAHIFFEMDLGCPWHSNFYPALMALGFTPCFVMPHVGKGDVVSFQYS